MSDLLAAALEYLDEGFRVVPIPHGEKGPRITEWQALNVTPETAPQFFNGERGNIGVIMGHGDVADVDLDCSEAIASARYLLPPTATFGHKAKPGSHFVYKSPGLADAEERAARKYTDPVTGGGLLELRSGGSGYAAQTVFPPSVHPSGEVIAWTGDAKIATVQPDTLCNACARLAACALLARYYPKEGARHDGSLVLGGVFAGCGIAVPHIKLMAEAIGVASGQPRDKIADMRRTAEDGAALGNRAGFPKLVEVFGKPVAERVAEWLGYKGGREHGHFEAGKSEPQFSEDQLGLAFTERHAQDLRYVAPWGKWFQWTGTHWRHETTLLAFDLARKVCREAAAQCTKPSEARNIARAKTVAAVEQLAKSDRAMLATIEQWDADKDLLNTPGGAIDLKTGELRPHSRDDYCTKITAIAPSGNCPMFLGFLDKIFAGDKDLIAYIQTALGYCLTGDIREHAMFFGYGTGANGKSVLLSTVAGIMGSYCKTAHQDTFTTTGGTQHPTDVAGLIGARLVICSEVEQGRRWAEAKIKSLTGGDRISARFMRQDFFEFSPQFKLFITGNHKPGLRNVDEAIRRRLHLVPFTITIPEGERDKRLVAKLRKEWPGILQWMIEGAVRWRADGLKKPPAVDDATREYFESEDTLLAWIEDRCRCEKRDETQAARLFESWKSWCELTGEFTGTARQFGTKLAEHGFERNHSRNGEMYRGISLLELTWP